jgi:hypothetical protein
VSDHRPKIIDPEGWRLAYVAAIQGLSANAQVCARSWSPEMLANRAHAIADATVLRAQARADLPPDTVSTRELETRMLMQDQRAVAVRHGEMDLAARIDRWLEGCG